MHECGTVRTIDKIRNVLNDFGRMKRLPKSMVCVDEDFYYIRGKNCSNDDCLKNGKQSWPLRSIFDARDPMTPKLNCTLSLTCSDQDVEILKKCLFKDTFESRKEFINLHENSRIGFSHPNEDEYFCCECEYVKCTHFDDEKSLDTSSRCYLALTCPICAVKIGKSCNRFFAGDCCIYKMKNKHMFNSLKEASEFCLNCYHFLYERSYLDFCIEGNIFENALRHGIR